MFESLFQKRVFNIEKALLFGLKKESNDYYCERDILDGMFRLRIRISSVGSVDTTLIERETAMMVSDDVISMDDLEDFSDDLKEAVKLFVWGRV